MKVKGILKLGLSLVLPAILSAQSISLDKEKIEIHLKNNSTNLINFPFVVQKANLTTETPNDFSVSSKNQTVVVIPTAELPDSESGDLLVWSNEGNPYLVKLKVDGKGEQVFNMVSNEIEIKPTTKAARFETGRIEKDIKRIIKKVVNGEKIPGYKRVDVKRKFKSTDLEMQKEYFYDGGKYRVEQWYIKNTTKDTLLLDYENFYTSGVLAIAFEKKKLFPGQITKAWLIINKNSIYQELEKKKIK